jgi:hypothetical protein
MVDIADEYIQKLTDAINDAGYKVMDVGASSPSAVRKLKDKMSEIAGSMTRLLKEQEHLDKQDKFANENKYLATIKVLTQDFKDVDTMVGEKDSKSASSIAEISKSLNKAEEAKPAYTPPKLRTDNPGGSWLKNKREQSIEDGKKKSGVPIRFGSVTGYFREGSDVRKPLIPVEVLARLQGMNDEQNNVRQKDLEAIKKIMNETGRLPQRNGEDHAPFINVYQDGTAYVNEGNHRIMAAKALGFKYLPIEISYFNGAEQVEDGDLSPKNVISYDMQANDDKFSLDNYSGLE